MFTRLINYSLALAVLSVLALIYQWTLVAWLQPADVSFASIERVSNVEEPSELDQLFPEGSWQRQAGKRLSIKDQGVVLFSERKQVTPSQWRVWPVTVVMQRDGRPPIILEAKEGADVTFAEPLDVLGSKAPPIKSGQLVGEVRMRSAPVTADEPIPMRDQMEIVARDVGIDSRRIWTNETIRLRWGQTILEGRNLTIRLAGGGAIPTSGGQSPLSILDSMELVYLDRLQIPVPARGRIQGNQPADVPDGVASIQCKGRVTFDFATDLLRVRDSVRIEHRPHAGPVDTIDCDSVTIEFNNPLSPDLSRESTDDWLKSIEAKGQPVIMRLPTMGAEAVAETIVYNATDGALRVQGSAGVRIAYQGINFQTTDLVYQFHASDPMKIGSLACVGSGFFDFPDDPAQAIKTMRWSKGFHLVPLATPNQHQLQVDGKVTTTLTDGGKVLADSLRFAFTQIPQPPHEADADTDAPERSLTESLRPEQASAIGNVIFDTSLLYAETRLLQLFFDVQTAAIPSTDADGLALQPASGATKRFWVKQPSGGEATVPPVARPRPTLTADRVNARVTIAGTEILGSDLSVDGTVRLTHQMATPQAVLPLTLQGDQLRLISKGGHDTIQIQGTEQPARFELGDGFFVGPLILVSTSDNYVWINQAGEFQMPTAVLPQGNANGTGPPTPMQWREPPRCRWNGSMAFDGQTVELNGGVQMSATVLTGQDALPWAIAATGDRMRMTLQEPVSIADPNAMRMATISDLSLLAADGQPVYLTADQTDVAGNLQARHVLSGPRLTLLPASGELQGPGPGWYRQWAVAAADGPFASLVPPGHLIATHLIFNEKMEGRLTNRELTFHQGVRIGVSPVQTWEQVFDAARLDALANGQATVDCQTLRLAQAPTDPAFRGNASAPPTMQTAAWEIEAMGGVAFRARNERGLYECIGNRASYAAAKDLFIVEGDGRRPATLKQTQPNGLPGLNIALGYLKIRPKTMEIDSELQMASPGMLPANMRSRRN